MLRRPTAALEKQQRSRPNIWDPDGVSQSLLQRFDQTGDAEKGAFVGEVVNGKVAFFKNSADAYPVGKCQVGKNNDLKANGIHYRNAKVNNNNINVNVNVNVNNNINVKCRSKIFFIE